MGRSMPIIPGVLSWVLVRRMDVDPVGQHSDELHKRVTCNSMVALAARLMEDCFNVIVDRQTRTNMIQSVVYSCGSNFTRTNFSRFYTAVLQLDGNIVSIASVRVPAPDLAEISFIATAENWRNYGLCKLIMGRKQ
ncbi:increased DNA methylation 1-like [Silene latifolia]|uniref:increased DNA methylation 1-like n=1 Tax=Silene latifolia TaxID=37657 RepID=UPI003D777C07